MRRLHLWRTATGAELARSVRRPGDQLAALDPAYPSGEVDDDGAQRASEAARELVHLIFESDVVVVW